MKLNVGCGKDYKEDFVNADISKNVKVDMLINFDNQPYPFKDNTFDYINCQNMLDHLHNSYNAVEELWRICKNEAVIDIFVAYYKSHNAFGDLTKHSFFNEHTFDNFTENCDYNFETNARFEILEVKKIASGKRKFIPIKSFFDRFLWDMYWAITFKLKVLK